MCYKGMHRASKGSVSHPVSGQEKCLRICVEPITSILRGVKELYRAVMLDSEPAGIKLALLESLYPQPLSDVIKGMMSPLGSAVVQEHHNLGIIILEIRVLYGFSQLMSL